MKYRVEWNRAARDALTEIWLRVDSAERKAVSEAVASIDKLFQYRPAQQGESREGDRRILFAHPLVVTFRVSNTEHTVQVLYVRLIKPRSQD